MTAWTAPTTIIPGTKGTAAQQNSDVRDNTLNLRERIGGANGLTNTANAKNAKGITVNQGDADDEILALKSSDVAHGMTDLGETDTFLAVRKYAGATGGVSLWGFTEATTGIQIGSFYDGADGDVSRATSSTGAVEIAGAEKSGTSTTTMTANTNMVVFRSNALTRFILDSDGESHADVGTSWIAFDDENDIGLVYGLAAELARPDEVIRFGFGDWLGKHRDDLARIGVMTWNDDGHHFINWSRYHMLINGAVRHLALKLQRQEERLERLEALLLPS